MPARARPPGSPPRLVLLDRDGTINVKLPEDEYVASPAQLALLPGAAGAIARLNAAGIPVAVVTNQRGIARGRMTWGDLDRVHAALAAALAEGGAHVDAIHACPHERDACDCRKPRPGLLLAALAERGVAPQDAVMVGDAPSDVAAGRAAGVATVRLLPAGPGAAAGEGPWAPDLAAAVDAMLG